MKLIDGIRRVAKGYDYIILAEVTDDDAKILETLGYEKQEFSEAIESILSKYGYEMWGRKYKTEV